MIRVNDNYLIDVTPLEYTALEDMHKTSIDKKTGKTLPVYNTVGHYGSLRSAVRGIVTRQAKKNMSDGEHSLTEAIRMLDDANMELERILSRIKEE